MTPSSPTPQGEPQGVRLLYENQQAKIHTSHMHLRPNLPVAPGSHMNTPPPAAPQAGEPATLLPTPLTDAIPRNGAFHHYRVEDVLKECRSLERHAATLKARCEELEADRERLQAANRLIDRALAGVDPKWIADAGDYIAAAIDKARAASEA